ncbi:DUF935 family protein [Roseivirga sp. UBA838]|uniref:phage portal protein family protein n=1 Tax=Roseivirga sp. UBA838 TaxID=1947393 RepID=UPI00257F678C|nr:DUF935 family protein [Roseivirga sp. UBA838]|tara:strand:- start:13064 stop:14446 length:1383 start_codon:yes stop_codon:yes gene_type:complete
MATNSKVGGQYRVGKYGEMKRVMDWVPKSVTQTKQDIRMWNSAQNLMHLAEDPQNYAIQKLYTDILKDALLSSQIENRTNQVFSTEFSLKNANGDVDEEQTKALAKMPIYRYLTKKVLESIYHKYSLVQLAMAKVNDKMVLVPELIPRENVVPQTGKFYPDYGDLVNYTLYRELPEYGTYILEFVQEGDGLLNKVVSHVLFKRFAQSCWSELCEIYGIPPRVLKTNTQNPSMLRRAEKMMRDMGAAAWFIIDDTESFEFAKPGNASGDVYKELIELCRDEICLVISGAILGQNTDNGSEAKDKVAMDILWQLVKSDLALLEEEWNNTIIPALVKHGLLKGELTLEYQEAEDLDALWKYVQGLLSHYNIDPEWIKQKFGVEVIEKKADGTPPEEGKKMTEEDLRAIIVKLAESGKIEDDFTPVYKLFKQALINIQKEDPELFSNEPRESGGELSWRPPQSA